MFKLCFSWCFYFNIYGLISSGFIEYIILKYNICLYGVCVICKLNDYIVIYWIIFVMIFVCMLLIDDVIF